MKIMYSDTEEELSGRLNNLRGLLALVVLLSHIWGYTGIPVLVPFNKVVTIAVAFFFFLSGYGMTRSADRKSGYLNKIFRAKIPYLLCMAFAAYCFSCVLEMLLGGSGKEFLPFGIRQFLISTNWYVWELTGFYLLFAFSIKFISKKYQSIFVLCVSAAAFTMLYKSGVVEAYYNSIIGFWLGMVCSRAGISTLIHRYKKGWAVGCALLAAAFACMILLDKDGIIFAGVRNLAAVGAVITAFYVIQYFNPKDKVNRYLSRISPEIYFYHMPIALLFREAIADNTFYTAAVLGMTFAVSAAFNYVKGIGMKKRRAIQ